MSPGEPPALAGRAVSEYQVGDFEQGSVYLERFLEVMRLTPPEPSLGYGYPTLVIPLVARITGLTDRLEIAEGAAQSILSSPSVTLNVEQYAASGLALLAVLRLDTATARQQYDSLQRWRGTFLPASLVAVDRLLGLLAHTMGNLDQAEVHFEEALAFCRKGYRPELAWTCCDYADTLLQRNEAGDREKATSLLDESSPASWACGP